MQLINLNLPAAASTGMRPATHALLARVPVRRPNTLLPPFLLFCPTHGSFLAKFTNTHSRFYAQCLSYTAAYGPSLHKGKIPTPQFPNPRKHNLKDEGHVAVFDEDSFVRIFDVAALRVPAKDCFALESQIRGHLLNWPRIRNIARVAGDDVEDDDLIKRLISTNDNEDEEETQTSLDSLNRRIYGRAERDGENLSPVMYRDKLAREFNSRGFSRFRHLARISRPINKKGKGGEGEKKREGKQRRQIWTVEVVEDEVEELKGLLGDGFKGKRKWTGPTRLLLLDQRYTDKGVEDLPEAIKVAIYELGICFEFQKSLCILFCVALNFIVVPLSCHASWFT